MKLWIKKLKKKEQRQSLIEKGSKVEVSISLSFSSPVKEEKRSLYLVIDASVKKKYSKPKFYHC